MSQLKQKALIEQIEKLNRYCTQYLSREANIQDAMGTPGTKLLVSIFEKADALKHEIATTEKE